MIVVVCDDTRTAVAYFNELKRVVKELVTLNVCRKPNTRSSAKEVLELAKGRRSDYRDANDSVWALLDLEGDQRQQTEVVALQQQAQATRVSVALSKPCYEMWTLLHLIDTGETFTDCGAVLNRLQREWRNRFGRDFPDKKAQADYSKIIDRDHRDAAAARAKMHRENGDPSWTEVYRLIEEIDRHTSVAPALASPRKP